MLIFHNTFSQKGFFDTILKVDSTKIKAKGIKIYGKEVFYQLANDKNLQFFKLQKRDIISIQYSNGKFIFYNIRTIPTPKIKTNLKARFWQIDSSIRNASDKKKLVGLRTKILDQTTTEIEKKSIEIPQSTKNEIKVVKPNEKYIVVSLSGLGNYMIGDELWAATKTGYGHLLGYGGNILVEYFFKENLAIGIKLGVNQWKTTLNFMETAKSDIYRKDINELTIIPMTASVRHNIGQHIFIRPEGSYNLIKIKSERFSIIENASERSFGYGIAAGYGKKMNSGFIYEISGFYQAVPIQNLQPINYAGLSLSIKKIFFNRN
jgi:hypothetical protein